MASGRKRSLTLSMPITLSGTTSTIHAAGLPSTRSMRETFTSGATLGDLQRRRLAASARTASILQIPAVELQAQPLGVDCVGLEALEA